MSAYFSDRENGPCPQTEETITPETWGGIVSVINPLISSGSLGFKYPEPCHYDKSEIIGTNEKSLMLAIRSELHGLDWPLKTSDYHGGQAVAPDTNIILDLIEFCYRSLAKPTKKTYHKRFKHYHLEFDQLQGQQEFAENINRIFARNGLVYVLSDSGQINRIFPKGYETSVQTHLDSEEGIADIDLEMNLINW
jgi:AbiJ-like protein